MEATATGRPAVLTGELQISLGVILHVRDKEVFAALRRHVGGERGDLPIEEWEAKKSYVGIGFAVFSAHLASDGTEFWIMTKQDRSATTVLLPKEARIVM